MDLLGSILNNMDAPPSSGDKESQKKRKEEKQKAAKLQAEERKRRANFRTKIEEQVTKFIQDTKEQNLKFPPMDKIQRSLIHDVAEVAGLISFSFGEEDVNRYIMLWKKEFAPSDAELEARRAGQEFDPEQETKQINIEQQISGPIDTEREKPQSNSRKRTRDKEPEKYFEKYQKILGKDSGVDAAKATTVNKSYGMVPSKNKEDQRSIEQTLKDIREKKKLKNIEQNDV